MAKIKTKGTILKHTISASLTAIAQLTGIEISGSEVQTYDSTTLDGGVYKTYDQTGYSEPGECTADMLFDPALAGHQFITDLIAAPADNAMQVTYADGANTTQAFTSAGPGFGMTVDMNDGLRGHAKWKIDGDPGWPT